MNRPHRRTFLRRAVYDYLQNPETGKWYRCEPNVIHLAEFHELNLLDDSEREDYEPKAN